MQSIKPHQAAQPDQRSILVGCLLDVSGSMETVLETGRGNERAVERLRAILRAALKLARAEQYQNPNALMFVGAFGLKNKLSPVVDLCELVDALLSGVSTPRINRSGHELLIDLANKNNVAYISKYIKERLRDEEARVVYMYLQRHEKEIHEFVNAIPPYYQVVAAETKQAIEEGCLSYIEQIGWSVIKDFADDRRKEANRVVDDSKAIQLAHRIYEKWLLDFKDLVPRPVAKVILLLERLQDHPSLDGNRGTAHRTLLEELRPHLYGLTPMRAALNQSLTLFRKYPDIKDRVLVMISDGLGTDGDVFSAVSGLREEKVTIATVYITNDNTILRRQLHDKPASGWDDGQRMLFNISTKVDGAGHPIPVLTSMGWEIPSSGECALYVAVCTADSLEEFCSVLLSARFDSADTLMSIVGRIYQDSDINAAYSKIREHPSDQENLPTCYSHAAAAILHMALIRIVDREGGYPTIDAIRDKIEREFPPGPGGRNVEEVLNEAVKWYRPLRILKVDENGARQAVLRRRPVLTTFRLSKTGWSTFSRHLTNDATRNTILSAAHMAPHRLAEHKGGHAVVLVECDPCSLTLLNSWGFDRGSKGSFRIENPSVLEVNGAEEWARMCFFDVLWYESDLTLKEQQAFHAKVNEKMRTWAIQHPGLLELEQRCPYCKKISPIANFTGNIQNTLCPLCHQSFKPEPDYLIQAVYVRASLSIRV
ncbi:hypothetical protein ACEPPN_001784 [Leptodophora sp. 'Broadleaf-Isolate-01']